MEEQRGYGSADGRADGKMHRYLLVNLFEF